VKKQPESPANGPAIATPAADRQLLATPLALRSELRLNLRKQNRRIVGVIEDPVRGRFFQVGSNEYHFMRLLDGKRPVSEVLELLQRQMGNTSLDEVHARQICNWLAQMNLLNAPCARSGVGRLFTAARGRKTQKLMGFLNPISCRLELFNPDRMLTKLTPWLGWIFSWQILLVWLVTGAVAFSIVLDNYSAFSSAAVGFLAPDRWLWLLLIWVVLKFVHEAAHGIACKRFGGEVPRAGLLFLLLAPLAFVDVTSSWRMTSTRQRMVVASAGMYVEMFLAFIAVFVWNSSLDTTFRDLAYNIIVMAGISTVLFNANPLIRFDGYYILSDLTGIVNLYSKGQAWLGNRFRHLVFGFPRDDSICPRSELRLVRVYAVCSFFWRTTLSISLLLAASAMLGGFGLLFAAVGAVFWIGLPFWNHLKRLQFTASQYPVNWKRFLAAATVTVLFVLACFVWIQAPAITSVPALVQYRDEHIARAVADGFIHQVLVEDGQQVTCGQLLVRLVNPDMQQELVDLQRSLDAAEVQERIHRQRQEIALQQAEQATVESLRQQILEQQAQLAAMEIRAPLNGIVLARGIESRQGSFVKRGEIVLRCVDPDAKKVLLSIDQQQAESVRGKPGQTVRLLFPGSPVVATRIRMLDPRATDIPSELALTAAEGGPLPVRPVQEAASATDASTRYRLIAPRFDAECDVPFQSASMVSSGQRGVALVRGRNLSLGGYVVHCCQQWIRKKLESANARAAG
jgi:putative peptide zinc metalloprotease protein